MAQDIVTCTYISEDKVRHKVQMGYGKPGKSHCFCDTNSSKSHNCSLQALLMKLKATVTVYFQRFVVALWIDTY